MDRLLHLDRTLDDLDPPRWGRPDADATALVRTVHGLRTVPLRQLRPADLRTLLSQQVALPYVLPLAVRLLLEDPLLDAYFHEGDLLHAAVRAPAPAWALLPDLHAALRAAITALPSPALADLPRDTAEAVAAFTA
ncbi:contact-dependent growth inhibition system immunity protein [Streptomyces sp. NPDC127110]|uniref:contact-dependent growth inhibition system immunity protein n=1 Tax=Streptomyces sp. NPDC127110 TaxID=3345362 RepID=UPI00363179B8